MLLLLVFCSAFPLGAKYVSASVSCDTLNEHEPVFTGSLNETSVGGNNLHVWGKICHVGIHAIFLSAWFYTLGCLSLCLSVCLFLPPAVQNEQRQHMCRYFQPPQERPLRSRHTFTWPNIHVQISSAIRACQYTTCFTLVVLQCCMCVTLSQESTTKHNRRGLVLACAGSCHGLFMFSTLKIFVTNKFINCGYICVNYY